MTCKCRFVPTPSIPSWSLLIFPKKKSHWHYSTSLEIITRAKTGTCLILFFQHERIPRCCGTPWELLIINTDFVFFCDTDEEVLFALGPFSVSSAAAERSARLWLVSLGSLNIPIGTPLHLKLKLLHDTTLSIRCIELLFLFIFFALRQQSWWGARARRLHLVSICNETDQQGSLAHVKVNSPLLYTNTENLSICADTA